MLCEVLAWFVKPVAQDESLKLSTMPGRRGLVSAREDAEEALAPAGASAASWGLTLDPPVSCQDPSRGRAGRRADNGDTASACFRRRRSSICRGRASPSLGAVPAALTEICLFSPRKTRADAAQQAGQPVTAAEAQAARQGLRVGEASAASRAHDSFAWPTRPSKCIVCRKRSGWRVWGRTGEPSPAPWVPVPSPGNSTAG